jgi:probable F420-dependent oxidoreductase
MTRPFRFGVTLLPLVPDRRTWVDAVRAAEQAGFSAITVMDHFRSGGIWAALVAAHEAAPSLRVGTLVLNNELSHPLILAREAITTDVLTDGSLELGIGAGWDLEDYQAVGRERAPADVRIERLAESLVILREACAGISPRHRGAHYVAEGPPDWPKPAQERIPLLVGGGGKRVLELAGAHADIVSISRNMQRGPAGSWRRSSLGPDGGPDRMDRRIHWVRTAAGERFADLELQAIVGKAVVTKDRDGAAHALGEPLGLTAEEVRSSPHFLIGTVEEMADDLERRRERWGISYWTLSVGSASGISALQTFEQVIARLDRSRA